MKRNSVRLLLSLIALIVGLSGCQSTSPDTNRDATKSANANVSKQTVDPVAIEAEITKLENDWAASVQRHDAAAVRKILADDVIMTYPDGSTGSKASELSDIEAGAMTVDSWQLFDTKVTVLGADAAVITGRSVLKNAKYKDQSAKKALDISGEYRFTDVYAKRNGQWLAVASQTTSIRNPAPASPALTASPKASASASPNASPR